MLQPSSSINGARPSFFLSSSAQSDIKTRLELFFWNIDKIFLKEELPKNKIKHIKEDLMFLQCYFGNLKFLAEFYYKNLKEKHGFFSIKYNCDNLENLLEDKFFLKNCNFYRDLETLYFHDANNPVKKTSFIKFTSIDPQNHNVFFNNLLTKIQDSSFSNPAFHRQQYLMNSITTSRSNKSIKNDEHKEKELKIIFQDCYDIFEQIKKNKDYSLTAVSKNTGDKKNPNELNYDKINSNFKIYLEFLINILIEQNNPEIIPESTIKKLVIKQLTKNGVNNQLLKKLSSTKTPHDKTTKEMEETPTGSIFQSLLRRSASIQRSTKESREIDKIILLCEKINSHLINFKKQSIDSRTTITKLSCTSLSINKTTIPR